MYKDKNPEFKKKPFKKYNLAIENLLLSAKNMPQLFSNRKIEEFK